MHNGIENKGDVRRILFFSRLCVLICFVFAPSAHCQQLSRDIESWLPFPVLLVFRILCFFLSLCLFLCCVCVSFALVLWFFSPCQVIECGELDVMTTVVVVVRCVEQNVLPKSCRPWECEEAVVHCGCFWQVSWSPGVNSGYPHPRQILALLHSLHWHGSLCYHCMFLYSVTMTLALLFLSYNHSIANRFLAKAFQTKQRALQVNKYMMCLEHILMHICFPVEILTLMKWHLVWAWLFLTLAMCEDWSCRWMLRKWQLQAIKGHRRSTGGTLAGLVIWLRRLLILCSTKFLDELLSLQCDTCYQKARWASLSLFLTVHAWICISRLIDVEAHMSIIYRKI